MIQVTFALQKERLCKFCILYTFPFSISMSMSYRIRKRQAKRIMRPRTGKQQGIYIDKTR